MLTLSIGIRKLKEALEEVPEQRKYRAAEALHEVMLAVGDGEARDALVVLCAALDNNLSDILN